MAEDAGKAAFAHQALCNPYNRTILERLPDLALDQAQLVAGCLCQTFWNLQAGRPADADIKDYDIFYFDPDTSWAAEDRVIRRAAALYADLPVTVEVRNQARVHLWFADRFGRPCPQYFTARASVRRFLVRATCVALAPDGRVYAPFGLDELAAGSLRPNPFSPNLDLYQAKAASYRRRWPWLKVADRGKITRPSAADDQVGEHP